MADSFIPLSDAGALGWMQTFAAGIAAAPATYQLTAADAAAIGNAVDAFAAAHADAIDPATRTPVIIAVKDEARNAAEQICRGYAIQIKYNAGVSDPDKIAIGVRPVNPGRTPISVPGTSPLLNVQGATPGVHTVRYRDSIMPDSRRKPFGAAGMVLFAAVAEAAVADPAAARFIGTFTRNPVQVSYPAAENTKIATYFARWQSVRGELAPWSTPVHMAIAA